MLFTPTLSADRDLATAADYRQWSQAAQEHDRKSGALAWRNADESGNFDYRAIRARLRLQALSAANDVKGCSSSSTRASTATSTAWGTNASIRNRASARSG